MYSTDSATAFANVGTIVGEGVGNAVGDIDGVGVGNTVGKSDGCLEGESDGTSVGVRVKCVGIIVGVVVSAKLGVPVSLPAACVTVQVTVIPIRWPCLHHPPLTSKSPQPRSDGGESVQASRGSHTPNMP